MKKILSSILLLFCAYFSFAQTFAPPSTSPFVTVQNPRFRANLTFYVPHTHGLTLNGGLDTLGATIYEDSSFNGTVHGHFWYRDSLISGGHTWTMIPGLGDFNITNLIQAGTNVNFSGLGTLASPYIVNAIGGGGGGGLDSVGFTAQNGFTGTFLNPGGPKALLSLGTSLTGILYGNGTGMQVLGIGSGLQLAGATLNNTITNNNQLTNGNNYISNITNFIQAGSNVTITGLGTIASPYVINSTGGGGGSGTVTNFSSGNLNPLFTTGVTNSSTIPAQTFTFNNVTTHQIFGNITGGTTTPTYFGFISPLINQGGALSVDTAKGTNSVATWSQLNSQGFLTLITLPKDTLRVIGQGTGIQIGNPSIGGDSIMLDRFQSGSGMNFVKNNDSSISVNLGGTMTQAADIYGNGQELIFLNFAPTPTSGFVVNFTNNATDATGDMFFRTANTFWGRLPIGTTGQILTVSGGLPVWATGSGGGGGSAAGATGDIQIKNANGGFSTLPSSLFHVDSTNFRIGVGTAVPTHTVTLDSIRASSGFVMYKTLDQVTNYSRLHFYNNGNIPTFAVETGGVGLQSSLNFIANSTSFSIGNGNGLTGIVNINKSVSGTTNTTFVGVNGTNAMSAGISSTIGLLTNVNQSGTATNYSLWISPLFTSTGNVVPYLIHAGTNSAVNGGGTDSLKWGIDFYGNEYINGSQQTASGTGSYVRIKGPDSVVRDMTIANLATLIGGGGSGVSLDSIDRYTGSTAHTVLAAANNLEVNPSATQTYNITLSTTQHNSHYIRIRFGGTLTSGVVWNGNIIAGSGWTIQDNTPPTSATADNVLIYWGDPVTQIWYREKP